MNDESIVKGPVLYEEDYEHPYCRDVLPNSQTIHYGDGYEYFGYQHAFGAMRQQAGLDPLPLHTAAPLFPGQVTQMGINGSAVNSYYSESSFLAYVTDGDYIKASMSDLSPVVLKPEVTEYDLIGTPATYGLISNVTSTATGYTTGSVSNVFNFELYRYWLWYSPVVLLPTGSVPQGAYSYDHPYNISVVNSGSPDFGTVPSGFECSIPTYQQEILYDGGLYERYKTHYIQAYGAPTSAAFFPKWVHLEEADVIEIGHDGEWNPTESQIDNDTTTGMIPPLAINGTLTTTDYKLELEHQTYTDSDGITQHAYIYQLERSYTVTAAGGGSPERYGAIGLNYNGVDYTIHEFTVTRSVSVTYTTELVTMAPFTLPIGSQNIVAVGSNYGERPHLSLGPGIGKWYTYDVKDFRIYDRGITFCIELFEYEWDSVTAIGYNLYGAIMDGGELVTRIYALDEDYEHRFTSSDLSSITTPLTSQDQLILAR